MQTHTKISRSSYRLQSYSPQQTPGKCAIQVVLQKRAAGNSKKVRLNPNKKSLFALESHG